MDFKKYNILYVDDEQSNLRIFKTSFKRRYNVFTAESGQEGLQILEEQPIDLILTDQKMPEMTGVEFLKAAVAKYPNPFRIIVTGFSDTESIIQAINECGIYHYITKPWKNEEMQFIIDKALEAYQLKVDNQGLMRQLQEANEDLEKKVVERTYELRDSRDMLEAQHKKITASINYALRIQKAMLPDASYFSRYLPDSFVFFKPRDIISGDFYWLDLTKSGDILLALADCTGHGVPGAFMTLIGNELLNSIVNAEEVESPELILQRLHEQVVVSLRQDIDEAVQDGMDIALCRIDMEAQKMYFSGGKNSLLVVRDGEAVEIKGDKHSIGGRKHSQHEHFALHTVDLAEKATYYLFTDGYIDQFGGKEGRKFMRHRLTALLQEIYLRPMQEQHAILEAHLKDWMGDKHPQIDDISVIGFRL